MYKSRPVGASAVGGIVDQISDGDTGVLLTDPGDVTAFAATFDSLLLDPERAEAMGERARASVIERFLPA